MPEKCVVVYPMVYNAGMAFERLRKQQDTEEILKQQRIEAAQEVARAEDLQREKLEKERQVKEEVKRIIVEGRRLQALDHREQSGIVNKLKEFTGLVKGLKLDLDIDDRTNPSSVVDKITWGNKLVASRPLPKKTRDDGSDIITVTKNRHTEHYLTAETFPDGKINIWGGVKFLGITYAYATIMPKTKWRNNPGVFEEPILKAYQTPLTRIYEYESKHRERHVYVD